MVQSSGNLVRFEGVFETAASLQLHIHLGGRVLQRWPRTVQVVAGVADSSTSSVILPTDDNERVVLQVRPPGRPCPLPWQGG